MEAQQSGVRYTYADYRTWDDSQRWELIDGVPYAMSPPLTAHQRVSRELFRQIADFLDDKPCEVFAAPFGVRLNADAEDDTVVEPDLVVICDKSKIDENGCNGAPDLIIEILSPSTASYDKVIKYAKYLAAGVKEYWIIDPRDKTVTVHHLHANTNASNYGAAGEASVGVLPGCVVDLEKVFRE
ncbi:MAG: Uma2 family endonuclease [Oscillospiraceae bacterium]|jgi:Uma2 family endonuclease|nr:Uma2 family endonuclease [Oscillospiraceae bacterium]